MTARPGPLPFLFCLVLGAALAAPASARDQDPLADVLLTLAPGDTVAWVDVRGADGRGVVGQPDAAALHLADGRRLPAADLARLWCRRLSRGPGFSRGLGGGMALGVLGCVAAANVYGRAEGGLQNLGAGILALGSLAAGALGTVGGDHPGLAYVGLGVDLLLGGAGD